MANKPKPAKIISAIDVLLPVLERARSHPHMYFDPIAPIQVIPWLHGLRTGYMLFQIHWPSEHRHRALERRELEATSMWEDERLLARGLLPDQVVTELISIEIEMWQDYRTQLQKTL